MLMNSQKLCEMNDLQFEELIMLIRYSSLNASKLSNNVAIAFLDGLLTESKVETQSALDQTNQEEKLLDIYDQDREIEKPATPKPSVVLKRPRSKLSFRRTMSKILVYFKTIGSKGDTIKEPKSESYVKYKREKFNISYAELIAPSTFNYDPMILNIPLYDFDTKPSFTGIVDVKIHTIDDYSDQHELQSLPSKSLLNSLFTQKVPWLNPTLSYTKLCRIKLFFMDLPNIVQHLDPSTSAIAWSLFERLILLGVVNKFNRKLFSAICFILAYKFNQDYEPEVIHDILLEFNKEMNVLSKYIFYNEMKIFTLLEFSLRLNYSHVQTHINDYLKFNGITFFNLYDTHESSYILLES